MALKTARTTAKPTTATPDEQFAKGTDGTTPSTPAGAEAKPTQTEPKPVSNDPSVPTADQILPGDTPTTKENVSATAEGEPTPASTDIAAATKPDGTVDPQAAAVAAKAQREQAESAKGGASASANPVPTGGITRQLEDGAETDRRTGPAAARSLVGENLPALRTNEPDPRQGVTTSDLTDPGVQLGDEPESVTFLTGYHLYNRGESAKFAPAEAQRLRDLGVAE